MYKVMVKIIVPEINQEYEIYIPINKTLLEVSILINKLVNKQTNGGYPIKEKLDVVNRRTGEQYNSSLIIRTTNIKHGTELVIY